MRCTSTITHNASGDIVDRYTSFDTEPLCEAVLCLKLGDRPCGRNLPAYDAEYVARLRELGLFNVYATFSGGADGTRYRGRGAREARVPEV